MPSSHPHISNYSETIKAGPSGMGRLRAGTLEARSLGGSPAAMSPVAVPCSVPKCNNDLYLSLLFFSD